MASRKTILVVDDIPLMRTMLVRYIKSLGLKILREELGVSSIDVLEAGNGREALESIAAHPPDLIFLDLMMPEMDGLAFLEAKKATSHAEVPVIVCSALNERSTVRRAQELGASSFIMKPFSLKAVETRFREALHCDLEDHAAERA